MRLLAAWLVLGLGLAAAPRPPRWPWWRWSVAALAASQALDVASSWGRPEANSLFGPRFGRRGLTIKAGVTGGVVLVQWVVGRRWPRARRPLRLANWAATGVTVGVAAHNFRVPQVPGRR